MSSFEVGDNSFKRSWINALNAKDAPTTHKQNKLDSKVHNAGLKGLSCVPHFPVVDIDRGKPTTFKQLALSRGLGESEIQDIDLYIAGNFESWVAGGQDIVVKKGGKHGLARTLEYLSETQTVVVHFKRKQGKALGEGHFAIVKQSLVHTSRHLAAGTDIADKVPKDKTEKGRQALQREGVINLLFRDASNVRQAYRVGDRGILLEGMEKPLNQAIRNGGLPEEDLPIIAAAVVAGLQEIHDKGYVHQDIHSGNIFCSWEGIWKIGDLGSAQEVGQENRQVTNLVIASPSQMTSQICGTTKATSFSDDLWSLGILLYELKTGSRPLFASSQRAHRIRDLVAQRNDLLKRIQDLPSGQRDEILGYGLMEPWQGADEHTTQLAFDFHQVRRELRSLYAAYLEEVVRFRKGLDCSQPWEELIHGLLNFDPKKRGTLSDVLLRLQGWRATGIVGDAQKDLFQPSNNNNNENGVYGAGLYSGEETFDSDLALMSYMDGYNEEDDLSYHGLMETAVYGPNPPVQFAVTDEQRIMEALEKWDIDALEELIQQGCDVVAWRGPGGETLLHMLVQDGSSQALPVLRLLLEKGADPNAKDVKGNTPLHLAVRGRRLRHYVLLWEKGADELCQNYDGLTPLGLAEACGLGYLDENRLLVGIKPTKEDYSIYTEWYLNQAAMLEFIDDIEGVTEEARRRLGFLLLYAFFKAAPHAKDLAGQYGLQMSPLFATPTRYYRSLPFGIAEGLRLQLAFELTKAQFASSHLCPVRVIANKQFINTLARRFSKDGVILELPPDGNLESILPALKAHKEDVLNFHRKRKIIKGIGDKEPTLLLDLTAVFQEHPEFLTDSTAWSVWWRQTLKIASEHKLSLGGSSVQIFSLLEHRNLNILYFPLRPELGMRAQDFLTGQIDPLTQTSGAVLSADQTLEAWIEIAEDIDPLIRGQWGVGEAISAIRGSGFPKVFGGFGEFLETNAVGQMKALMADDSLAPFARIMAEATNNLLWGLEPLKVDAAFEKEGLQDLLQWIYYKLVHSLGEVSLRKRDMVPFLNEMEVIHQEIQNILGIVSISGGYGPGKFAELEVERLTNQASPVVSIQDFDLPRVALTPSAMGGISTVLAAMEAQKGSGQLNVLLLKDSYYECSGLLSANRSHSTSVLDGDSFREKQILKMDNEMEEPIDLFVAEFNHNISINREEYHPEDIRGQILALYDQQRMASPCTLLLDTTLEVDPDASMREFLNDPQIKQLVQDGELNVVFVRSAQKFDMLGMDNYYGGIVTAVNNSNVFEPFNEWLTRPEFQQGGLAYQGMTHLKTCLGDTVQKYRQAIHNNLEKLYALVPAKMKVGKEGGNPVRISKLHAGGTVFLDINTSHSKDLMRLVVFALTRMAEKEGLPLTCRASFGFHTTNLVEITKAGVRLTPGLEGDDGVEKYAAIFQEIQNVIDSLEKKGVGKNPQWLQIVAQHIRSLYREKPES